MKTYQGLILFVLTFFLSSFTTTLEMDDVVTALKTGNANQLSRYFDSRVDLTLPDKSDNYSRTQAEMILKDFFNSNNVKNFELKHKGENNGSKFCIGILHTKNGNYRTKLFMKLKDNKQVLQEIAFQSE
ncbi:MAG: hypothetical protein RLZZ316_1002 [Bacteroidota bacterium]|jgi:hypothetical protein